MLKTRQIQFFIIFLAIAFLPLQLFNCVYAEFPPKKDETIRTVKIIFSKNETGQLTALIIPHTLDGHYPKSGWIHCDIIATDIGKIYSEKLKNQEKIEGYFIATYRKIEKDKSIGILRYKGELIKLEPWNPEFIKDSK